MKITSLALLGGTLIAGPIVATAQTETLTYSGGAMTGSLETDVYENSILVSSFTSSLDGSISGSITLSGQLPLNGTTTVDPIGGNFNTPFNQLPPLTIPGESELFTFTTKNGAIVGWNIQLSECPCYGSAGISMSNHGGDSYSVDVGLAPDLDGNGTPYSGSASGPSGSWKAVVAPEIDGTATASSLALLVGGLRPPSS